MRLKEGDANSKFFHLSVKQRGRKNYILALNVDKRWVKGGSGGSRGGCVVFCKV